MAKIYTKTGDKGQTGLVSGQCVSKDHPRVDAYGQIDELNSRIGMARIHTNDDETLNSLSQYLERIQNELFNLGSLLACDDDSLRLNLPAINEEHVQFLESIIDQFDQELPELKTFIIPGGSALASQLHLCRTACRKAERSCVTLKKQSSVPEVYLQYLNRLSDFFFVSARMANWWLGIKDFPWRFGQGNRL